MNSTKTNLKTLKDIKSLGRKPQKGDVFVPNSMAYRFYFGKLEEEIMEEAKRYIAGEISKMRKNAQLWETMPLVTGCDSIVDHAFVPDMTDREKTTEERLKFSTLDEILAEFRASGAVVDCGYAADPDDGPHAVTVREYQQYKGRNGQPPFVVFTLREDKTGKTWDFLLSIKEGSGTLINFVFSVSRNNGGIFEGDRLDVAFSKLTSGKIHLVVYTYKRARDGKVLTYFDVEKYKKYLYMQSKKDGDAQLREQKRAEERAVAEAGDSISRKAPWDE